ncbi:MAG: sensor histidine kinase, partial [Bdellovibrionales bacterium]|nr:sensor histidine kinase [Bdellovibrionales bacterium]
NFEMELIKKDIRVVYQTQSPHVKIISYPHLLEITLVALIENAIHYSGPESQITIHLSSSDHWVKIQIQDQGMGMDEEEMEQIFERFYRAEKAQALYANGTGVGLALVDLCVKRLGGKIEVESQVEQGTVFSIQLPENIRKYFTDPTAEGS